MLTLNEQHLQHLNMMLGEMPHKHAVQVIHFINQLLMEQRAVKAAEPDGQSAVKAAEPDGQS